MKRHLRGAVTAMLATAGLTLAAGPASALGTRDAAALQAMSNFAAGRQGVVCWNSRRVDGRCRIWACDFDGANLRQVSPNEPDKEHIAPVISPDGSKIAYCRQRQITGTGVMGPEDFYGDTVGDLVIVDSNDTDGSSATIKVSNNCRTFREWRALRWLDDDRIAYIGADHDGYVYTISSNSSSRIFDYPYGEFGAVPEPQLGHCIDGYNRIFRIDNPGASGTLTERGSFSGCQGHISWDGNYAVRMNWVGGCQVMRIRMSDLSEVMMLDRHDSRFPAEQHYLYFPRISKCQRFLAIGASPEQHHHYTADYDVFVMPLDPASCLPTGNAVKYSFGSGSDGKCLDSWPDVWVAEANPSDVSIDSFTADPASIASGSSSTLSWQTSNATSVKLDGQTVNADSSTTVSPTQTTTYTLTAEGQGGPVTRSVAVDVMQLRDPDNPSGVTQGGVNVDYYDCSVGSLPNFGSLTSYASDTVTEINYGDTTGEFATSGRVDNVGAVFAGYVEVASDGVYTFHTTSDDGSALYIGATKVVDNDGAHGMQERSGQIGLKAGKHAIRVEFFEAGGGAGLIVSYEGPGVDRTVIPSGALYYYAGSPTQVSIDSFTASPGTIAPGGSSTLQWQTSNATSVTLDGAGVAVTGSQVVTPASTTTYVLQAEGPDGPRTRSVTVTVSDPGTVHVKINCGGGAVGEWDDDGAYVSGGGDYAFAGTPDIAGVTDPAPTGVYLSCRREGPSFAVPVDSGTYLVRLHFYDEWATDGRAMEISIEGSVVLSGFSIQQDAGGIGKALVKEFANTTVSDASLDISIGHGTGNDAFVCGIEIIGGASGNLPPTAAASAVPTSGAAPLAVQFTGGGTDADGSIVSYHWSFGDGGSATGQNPSHTYAGAGNYTVTLTVTDDAGAIDTATVTITASEPATPTLTVTYPNGGEKVYVGTTCVVRWTASLVDNVAVMYSPDGGSGWNTVNPSILEGGAGWLAYEWTVPDSPSGQCLVRVDDYGATGAFDESDAPFEIRQVVDSDGDGMDDRWETDHFGDMTHDKTTDADGDGKTDYEEFMAGTDPTVGEAVGQPGTGFTCVAGVGAPEGVIAVMLLGAFVASLRARKALGRATG